MNSDPFDKFVRDVASDPLRELQARWRRSAITSALKGLPDVVEVIPSGSLARGTNWGPIHDIDLIVVFDKRMHPDWRGSGSAQVALEHMQALIRERLQFGLEHPLGLVHQTEVRNHVVKCELDPSMGPLDAVLPNSPPVDVMPAFREGSHLRVPERRSDRWIDVDPERLTEMVAARQRSWGNFDEAVRMMKDWADNNGLKMKSLAVEAMVLEHLPKPGFFETMSCCDAIARLFKAASEARITRLVDPTGRCGEIDPHINYGKLRKALDKSAELAAQAVKAERAWERRRLEHDGVTHPSVFWQEIFGRDRFKRPSVWYWHPRLPAEQPAPEARHWFDRSAEPADESRWSWRPAHDRPFRPGPTGHATEPREPHPDTPREARTPRWSPSLDDVLGSDAQDIPATPSVFG